MYTQKTRYSATFDGCTFTRSTARVYTHAVIIKFTTAVERQKHEASARQSFRTNLEYHRAYAAGTSEFLVRNSWETEAAHQERVARDIERAREWLALGVDGHVAAALARFDAAVAKTKHIASDGTGYYGCAGWCGRADLAHKLAARSGGFVVTTTEGKS